MNDFKYITVNIKNEKSVEKLNELIAAGYNLARKIYECNEFVLFLLEKKR